MHDTDNSFRKVIDYYAQYDEQGRLTTSIGQVEYIRSVNIINRYLKPPPAKVLDVGGAAGRYACWLAREGYQVTLIDPVPRHVQQAENASAAQSDTPLSGIAVGDARQLDFNKNTFDAVLLMGPLYHLVDRQDRQQALSESYRVLKPGGILFAVGISRFASTIDGLVSGYFEDEPFKSIMLADLKDGQHRNPTSKRGYFTDAFFHHPDELISEVADVGYMVNALLAIEGISYMMKEFDRNWADEAKRKFLLSLIEKTEKDPTLMGASPHMMCVGIKQN